MSAMKIKKGDTVKVIAGKDNGKEGKVLAVNAKDNTVIVENINKVTKHSKPSAANQQGGIITKEAPLHISNVMLVVDGQATRVGFQMDGDKKVRVAKKTGKVIVAHEDALSFGYGAEIAARIGDELFEYLDAPVRRVAALDTFVAYAPQLEDAILPQVNDVAQAITQLYKY